ncbi:hypothetical protein ScPMuIL_004772 [Solemya velum]
MSLNLAYWLVICIYFLALYSSYAEERNKISFLCSTSKGQGKFFAGSFIRALHDVNNNTTILPNLSLAYLFHDTLEDTLEPIRAMTATYGNGTIAFIGPDGTCATEAMVAAAWNLPLIAFKCHDSALSRNEEVRRTFARTQPSTSKVSKSIISMIKHFGWRTFSIVVGSSAIWNETAQSLVELSEMNNIIVSQIAYFQQPYAPNDDMYSIIINTFRKTRIYVFLGDYHALVDFARYLHDIPNTNKGEYVVIAVDERPYNKLGYKYFLKNPFESKDQLTKKTIQAFQSVLLLVPRAPGNPDWQNFLDNVRELNHQAPVNAPRRPHIPGLDNIKLQVPIYTAYLYDAVMVYSRAVDEVLREGGSVTNGTAILAKIRSRTFISVQGHEVYIDRYGDAEGNYSLLSLKNDDVYYGTMRPVGNFRMTSSGLGLPVSEIDWKLGRIPVDEPSCGFENERCRFEPDWKTATICSVVAAAVIVGSVFICRHYLYEQKLARLLWKLERKDLVIVESTEDLLAPSSRKKRSQNPWRSLLFGSDDMEKISLLEESRHEKPYAGMKHGKPKINVGFYKGTPVAIKHLLKKNIEINRTLKKQLQLRKELNNDNINRFIGACVEPPHLYIVTQYTSRGSLEDILQNKDVHLDDMFIASLVADLIKGMIFLHDSVIVSHGKLHPGNCMVDSRWVLQLCDFGLHQLVNSDSIILDENKYFKGLLWRAPELLRQANSHPRGTQKGDVYSFALILHQIHDRRGPWGDLSLSHKEIVERVRVSFNGVPFRPDTASLRCEDFVITCIKECWSEDPEQRPDFKSIRTKLKPMQQGLKPNIFDNMLAIMEKHATNLEAIVAERTEQLSEEKKMTENLLLRMLPRSVADQLIRGHLVVPELYETVSLYFSDIVGFTALSAESTPMQVVDLLNDLYTLFDSIIENYDVYKVETIGDAYMVVSGIPIRNQDRHAGEIASMSLHLLRAIKTFKMSHRPEDTLKLRIGVHSGSCVAGVVGLKMPRYCLFGDTVNTASRMESTGVALKIHCSEETAAILKRLQGYTLVERGYVNMKGKGERLTYFLEGEDESHRKRRLSENYSKSDELTRSASSILSSIIEVEGSFTELDESRQNGSLPHCDKKEMSRDDTKIENCVNYEEVINRLNCESVYPAITDTTVMCANFTDVHQLEERRYNWDIPESPGEMETEKLPLMATDDAKSTVPRLKSSADEHTL